MEDAYSKRQRQLLQEVTRDVSETSQFLDKARLEPATVEALAKVPRHEFVPLELRAHAYENRPLPIGQDQTISQPYIVAIMTDMLRLTPESRVLEIGTGCGYQAVKLAEIAARVVTLERVGTLADAASERLSSLGYGNISVIHADGNGGWPKEAPYDAIIVTAVAECVPEALLAQLKAGGRMVIPLGKPSSTQLLVLLEKACDGAITEKCHLPVAFVPLVTDIRH